MGGHSLLATQLITRVQQQWQIVLPLRAIFDHPTVASLAEQIEASQLAAKLQALAAVPAADEMELVL